MTVGISHKQLDGMSGSGLLRAWIIHPLAQDLDYFSSASDGGAQAAQSIASSVVGNSLNRSATGKRPLLYGRRLKMTVVDNAGNDLAITVRVPCRRFGKLFTEDLAVTAGTLTATGTKIVDELAGDPKIISISNNGASDTYKLGFDDSWIGLRAPFRRKASIRMVHKDDNGTPDANGPKMNSDLTAAMVKAGRDSGLDLKALYSATALAVTDVYCIEYSADGDPDFYSETGLRFAG